MLHAPSVLPGALFKRSARVRVGSPPSPWTVAGRQGFVVCVVIDVGATVADACVLCAGWLMSGVLKSFLTLLAIVDPVAIVPLFLAMTAGDSPQVRRRMAARAAVVAGTTLSVFAAVGDALFALLGISIPAFRIAGGILLFLLAVDMLMAQPSRHRTTPEETAEGVHKPDVSVFPLGIPMLAGPGSITVVMMARTSAETSLARAWVFASILAVAAVSFVVLAVGGQIADRLGQTGMNVMHRVFGLLLAAIAAQFVVDGIRDAFFVRP